MSLTSFFTIVCFEIDVLVCILFPVQFSKIMCTSAVLIYITKSFPFRQMFFLFFSSFFHCIRLHRFEQKNRVFQLYLKCSYAIRFIFAITSAPLSPKSVKTTILYDVLHSTKPTLFKAESYIPYF